MARQNTSLSDLKSARFYASLVAEMLGTLLLVLIGCGAAENEGISTMHIAFTFGLTVAGVVWAIANISGGHINPGVTIGFLVARRISLVRAVGYVAAQIIGAALGAGLLKLLTPINSTKINTGLGLLDLGSGISIGQGVGTELMVTFTLVLVVFSSVDSQRTDLSGSAPLAIGLTVTMCHLWGIPFTGSGMNPARAFGPALILGKWDNHWIYWVGPLVGGVLGAFLYDFVFAVNATPAKLKGFFTTADYDNDHYDANGRRPSATTDTEMKP